MRQTRRDKRARYRQGRVARSDDGGTAVKRLAELLGQEPAAVVLDMPGISVGLEEVNPVAIGMTAKRLAGLIRRLPEGLSEIYLHPATAAAYDGCAPGYRYVEEFEALIDPAVIAAARAEGLALGGFADFARLPERMP